MSSRIAMLFRRPSKPAADPLVVLGRVARLTGRDTIGEESDGGSIQGNNYIQKSTNPRPPR
jgi:hypothetical protein